MKFKLLAPHYLPGDRLLLEGAIIGDGTPFPVDFKHYPPTHEMEGLDDVSIKAAANAMNKFMQNDPIETLPINNGAI